MASSVESRYLVTALSLPSWPVARKNHLSEVAGGDVGRVGCDAWAFHRPQCHHPAWASRSPSEAVLSHLEGDSWHFGHRTPTLTLAFYEAFKLTSCQSPMPYPFGDSMPSWATWSHPGRTSCARCVRQARSGECGGTCRFDGRTRGSGRRSSCTKAFLFSPPFGGRG